MNKNKREILIFTPFYLPGFKGGVIQIIANTVERLHDKFTFKIVTADRELGALNHYAGILPGSWQRLGNADVCYLSKGMSTIKRLKELCNSTPYDLLFFNSFFSPSFTMKPLILRKIGLIPQKPILLAPRGEFSKGALAIKSFKKYLFLKFTKLIGLYGKIIWQASSKYEEIDIQRYFGDGVQVLIAQDLPPKLNNLPRNQNSRQKKSGFLSIVFLSRISPKKNLDYCFKLFNNLNGQILFKIYGPIEDRVYWEKCTALIESLPDNVDVKYCGEVKHDQVGHIFEDNDVFLFPTLGENFGYVILESLIAGCPVIISDRTPWRDLKQKGVGWELPLDKPDLFREVLKECISMDNDKYLLLSEKTRAYGNQCVNDENALKQNMNALKQACGI